MWRRAVILRLQHEVLTRIVFRSFTLLHGGLKSLKPKVMNKLRYKFFLKMKKVEEGVIIVDKSPYEIDVAVYTLRYKGEVIKVGLAGNGNRTLRTRMSDYRSGGRNILERGEHTLRVLNARLKVGEEIDVYACKMPKPYYDENGWKVGPLLFDYEQSEQARFSKRRKLWLR